LAVFAHTACKKKVHALAGQPAGWTRWYLKMHFSQNKARLWPCLTDSTLRDQTFQIFKLAKKAHFSGTDRYQYITAQVLIQKNGNKNEHCITSPKCARLSLHLQQKMS